MRWTMLVVALAACDVGTIDPGNLDDPDAELCAFVEANAGPLQTQQRAGSGAWVLVDDDQDGTPTAWSGCEPRTTDGAGYVDIVAEWSMFCVDDEAHSEDGVRRERWSCPVTLFDQGWDITGDCTFVEFLGAECGGQPYDR